MELSTSILVLDPKDLERPGQREVAEPAATPVVEAKMTANVYCEGCGTHHEAARISRCLMRRPMF